MTHAVFLGTTTTPLICGFSCLNQSWISSSDLLGQWAFDGTFLDETNAYNAIPINSPSFTSSGYVNQALMLNASANQYLTTPYIPLVNASFTVELWIYPTGFPNPTDHGILGLCTHPSNDQCLHLTIRRSASTYHLYMSFFGDNWMSIATVPLNTWTHAAFTFDRNTLKMSIYLNGRLTVSAISALPLQGIPNIVTIGYIPGILSAYGNNFFHGFIDHLGIAHRAKPACEILDDASLATHYNFDNGPVLNDSGPNSLLNTAQSVSWVSSGHFSGAISFTNATSSVQIAGLTGLGTVNAPFSISLWIRPVLLAGTLVYVSRTATAQVVWCMSMMGFASNGSLVIQIWTGTIQALFGPRLSTSSVWYHTVQTWSSTNGLRLYIN
jgi:hypothetical protein